MTARYFGLIPAAGKGSRFGGELPKQYQPLRDRAILAYAIDALALQTPLSRVYVVHAEDDHRCVQVTGTGYRIATMPCGGASRAESVRNGLASLRGELSDDDWVVVHDAVRPCLPKDALRRLLYEVGDDPVGGLLAIPVTDTLKREDKNGRVAETAARAGLWQAQTPQMFRYGLLWDAYQNYGSLDYHRRSRGRRKVRQATQAGAGQQRQFQDHVSGRLRDCNSDSPATRRLTMRVGQGFDAHALVPGRALIIGGVAIPYERGLAGHSDADVLLHAVCDALLGAAGLGDIGEHFPDTAAEFKDIDSRRLLRRVNELIAPRWTVVNVDATVIAQAPRLSPFKAQMAANIAADLGLDPAQVNVKAKTTEGLGFTGRGEGIAAQAVVLLAQQPEPQRGDAGA